MIDFDTFFICHFDPIFIHFSSIFSTAVPDDFTEQATKLHPNPSLWWFSELLRYLFRARPETEEMFKQRTGIDNRNHQPEPATEIVKPESGIVKPEPRTGIVKPEPKIGNVKPKPKNGVVKPELKTGIVKPEPKTGIGKPKPKTGIVKPELKTGIVKPEADTGIVKPELKAGIVKPEPETGIVKPIVAIHVRRGDKNREAHYQPVEAYMKYVEEYFELLEIKNQKKLEEKRVYVATDDPNVLDECRLKFPG